MSVETEGVALVVAPDAGVTSLIKEPPTSEPILPHSALVPSAPSGVPPAPATKWSSDEAVAQADLPDVPFRFSEKKRLNWSDKTCTWSLSPEVTSDKRSSSARSRTLDYSWKSCESGAVEQSVVFSFPIPALQTALCLPGC